MDTYGQVCSERKIVNASLFKKAAGADSFRREGAERAYKRITSADWRNEIDKDIMLILYVEQAVTTNDLPVAHWRFCNYLKLNRNVALVQRPSKPACEWTALAKTLMRNSVALDWEFSCLYLPGRLKTKFTAKKPSWRSKTTKG
jgi:hypothetical protein